jgi:hypothetical protein
MYDAATGYRSFFKKERSAALWKMPTDEQELPLTELFE